VNAKQFEKHLAAATDYSPSEIDQRTRFLRQLESFPAVRGTNAPDIDPIHAAMMLLALVSRRAADSQDVFHRLIELQVVPRSDLEPDSMVAMIHSMSVDKSAPLVTILALFLMKRPDPTRNTWSVFDIAIRCDGSLARIRFGSGKTLIYTDRADVRELYGAVPPATYDAFYTHYIGHSFVIGGLGLVKLAADISINGQV